MSEGLSISGADDARRAMENYAKKLPLATDRGVAAVASALEAELKSNRVLQQTQNSGGRHIGPPGGFPNRRTGRLANSIMTERVEGFGTYGRKVGAGMIYARSLELGNPRWRSGVRYPFIEPTAAKLRPQAQRIFTVAFKRNMGL